MGMNGFRRRSRTKQLGNLRVLFCLGLGGEGEILAVGLTFTSKGGLKVVLGRHWFFLPVGLGFGDGGILASGIG
jgi:hypothetical protein